MSMISSLVRDELTLLDVSCANQDELFTLIADVTLKLGYTKPSYLQAIKDRESQFPTGLPVLPYAIAIPHTYPEHIAKNGIGVIRLNEPVEFNQMGSMDTKLSCKYIFPIFLEGKLQVDALSSLMQLFQDAEFLNLMEKATGEEIREYLTSKY
ncbi:MAG: PTS sugar transporter subunit IIA [Erysipelotrichaceae bacterium]